MLVDQYDLALSTTSSAARDAYVQGSSLLLTLYPGAIEAFDRAIATAPGFALAHARKAQVLMREGNVAAARARCRRPRKATDLPAREASHIAFFDLVFSGGMVAAIAGLHEHLIAWPRDALVLASAANPNGLIGASGRVGQKHRIAALMDSLAPDYGDDPWFLAYHAMALSEDRQLAAARPKIERSVAMNPNNVHAAHGFAHVCYESGEPETARAYGNISLNRRSRRTPSGKNLERTIVACRTTGKNDRITARPGRTLRLPLFRVDSRHSRKVLSLDHPPECRYQPIPRGLDRLLQATVCVEASGVGDSKPCTRNFLGSRDASIRRYKPAPAQSESTATRPPARRRWFASSNRVPTGTASADGAARHPLLGLRPGEAGFLRHAGLGHRGVAAAHPLSRSYLGTLLW